MYARRSGAPATDTNARPAIRPIRLPVFGSLLQILIAGSSRKRWQERRGGAAAGLLLVAEELLDLVHQLVGVDGLRGRDRRVVVACVVGDLFEP